MNLKLLRYFLGIFTIVLLIGSLAWSYATVMKIIETDKQKTAFYNQKYGLNQMEETDSSQPIKYPAQQYMNETDSNEYKAIASIRALHASSDFLFTGGKVEKYTIDNEEAWKELLKADLMQLANYDRIAEGMAVEPNIILDMNNLKELVKIGEHNRDLNALKYIHRILHDLDLFAYPPAGQLSTDFWGATHTAPSELSKMLKEIEAFIASNKIDNSAN